MKMTNYELYGTEDVPPIPKEVAMQRITLLQKNLDRELQRPFKEQNSYKVSQILKAIDFWSKMAKLNDVGV